MSSSCRIAIVGGGLAGLAAANALKTFGMKAEVFETAPALGEIGAAVNVSPQAVKALQAIGVGDKVAAVGELIARNLHAQHANRRVPRIQRSATRLRRGTALPITPFTAPTCWTRSQAGSIIAPFIWDTA